MATHRPPIVSSVMRPLLFSAANQSTIGSDAMTEPRQARPERLIDPKAFWRAIGNRATGSTVVTAASDRGPAGFLGLSATHVCADPPLMLVSIDRRTSALETVLAARHFALNFLPRGANALADTFGGKGAQKGTARFEPGKWTRLQPERRSCAIAWAPSIAYSKRQSSGTAS
jgi:flavin reductase (DIM6/NTAB) family NADH-FMN oxidoreductase RutF